jgi:hypothetical protein
LLDWTENALVAAYFAVADEPGRDGELWVLQPLALNKEHGQDSVPCADEVDSNLRLLLTDLPSRCERIMGRKGIVL